MSATTFERELAEISNRGFADTPAGRFYLRCGLALPDADVRAQEAEHASDPRATVFRTCRRRLRHGTACSPKWEANPGGVR